MFQIDEENFQKIMFGFVQNGYSMAEVNTWPFWQYETQLKILSDYIKKKQEKEHKAHAEAEGYKAGSNPAKQASGLLKQAQSGMPKAPAPFKMPKF